MIYYQEPNAILYQGHALTELPALPSESVDCVMTSPPYWGLRTYKTEPQIWGENHCEHEWGEAQSVYRTAYTTSKRWQHVAGDSADTYEIYQRSPGTFRHNVEQGNFCLKCHAWRGELGLEPTIELYISHLVQIFDEVKRILKPTGTLWINIDDSYSNLQSLCEYAIIRKDLNREELEYVKLELWRYLSNMWGAVSTREKQKGKGNVLPVLSGTMQGEGRLQREVLPISQNMVSEEQGLSVSQNSRTQSSTEGRDDNEIGWEMCLLWGITQGVLDFRPYQGWGQAGIPESNGADGNIPPSEEGGIPKGQVQNTLLELQRLFGDLGVLSSLRVQKSCIPKTITKYFQPEYLNPPAKSLCLIPSRFALAMVEHGWILRNDIVWYKSNPMPESVKDRFTGTWEHLFFFVKSQRYWFEQQFEPLQQSSIDRIEYPWHLNKEDPIYKQVGDFDTRMGERFANPLGRNKRDVWEINTQPYPEPHFATFPEKLCETPILSGCPSQICKKCGKAREKVYKTGLTDHNGNTQSSYPKGTTAKRLALLRQAAREKGSEYVNSAEFLGYTDCGCGEGWTAGVVFDPFCGSGKALSVAKRLGRKAIGIDLNPDYCKLAVKELQKISMPMEL